MNLLCRFRVPPGQKSILGVRRLDVTGDRLPRRPAEHVDSLVMAERYRVFEML